MARPTLKYWPPRSNKFIEAMASFADCCTSYSMKPNPLCLPVIVSGDRLQDLTVPNASNTLQRKQIHYKFIIVYFFIKGIKISNIVGTLLPLPLDVLFPKIRMNWCHINPGILLRFLFKLLDKRLSLGDITRPSNLKEIIFSLWFHTLPQLYIIGTFSLAHTVVYIVGLHTAINQAGVNIALWSIFKESP